MILKYDIDIQDTAVYANLSRLTNQIYKLLPCREEGSDWEKPLATLMEEGKTPTQAKRIRTNGVPKYVELDIPDKVNITEG